jgi:hypothetical protein
MKMDMVYLKILAKRLIFILDLLNQKLFCIVSFEYGFCLLTGFIQNEKHNEALLYLQQNRDLQEREEIFYFGIRLFEGKKSVKINLKDWA